MSQGAGCPDAVRYLEFVPQYVSMIIHTIISLAAIGTNGLFIIVCFKHLHFHFNCRILITTLLFVNICHSITYATMLVIQLVIASGSGNSPCDAVIGGRICFIIRLITSSCYTAHTTVLLGLLIERFVATKHVSTYENCSHNLGYLIALVSILTSVLVGWYKMHKYPIHKQSIYCSTVTPETNSDVLIVHSGILILLLAIVIFYGIAFFQSLNVRSRISRNVSEKCQAAENLRVLRMLTPLLVFHFICYPTYFVLSIIIQFLKGIVGDLIFRVIFSAIYFISYYCVLSPLFLLYIVRKKNKKEQAVFSIRKKLQREDEIYFQNYRKMW